MPFEIKLYLLELEDDKYYVGQSDNPEFRFLQHQGNRGSMWTRLHKPLRLLKTKAKTVNDTKEAMLYENWMTLKMMEVFGWENVRGGDFLFIESYKLQPLIAHLYDFEKNKIKYYLENCPYLFGSSDKWHIYVLELADQHYYIGSCKQLGKALGEHFNGNGIEWTKKYRVIKVAELITTRDNYIEIKNNLIQQYISKYGWANVLGGQMPKKTTHI